MDRIISVLIIIAGLINLAPLIGILSRAKLGALYRLSDISPDLEILLRHRALMFGLIGGFMLYGPFRPNLWWPVITIGLISMAGFIVLAGHIGAYGPEIKKIMIIDAIGIAALVIAAGLHLLR